MPSTILERLLIQEHERRRKDVHTGDFSVPAMGERPLEPDCEPLLATNMRGQFVETRLSRAGVSRYGFCVCDPEEEGVLLRALVYTLVQKPWALRCNTLVEATTQMRELGLDPYHVVVPFRDLEAICGRPVTEEEAGQVMSAQGFIAEAFGLKVLAADLPGGVSLVTAAPAVLGYHTRVYDRLGITITRASDALCVVGG